MPISELKDKVLSHYNYNVISIENIKFKDTDKQRAVYKVITNHGAKCLKKVYYDEPSLLFVYSVIEWLSARGILSPRLITTKEGLKYVSYNNNLFILTPWIDGRKCSYDNIDDIKHSAKTLAKLHKTSYGFYPIEGSSCRTETQDYESSASKHFSQILQSSNSAFTIRDEFSRLYLDCFDYNFSRAKESMEILSSIDLSRPIGDNVSMKAICHLDYVNKNIIFTPDNEICIIDFDKTAIDMPSHDLIVYTKRIMKREKTSWDFDIFLSAMESYESIRPLSVNEYNLILSSLMFPNNYWKISRDYYKNRHKCNKNAFVNALKKIRMQNQDHNIFCNSLKEYISSRFYV